MKTLPSILKDALKQYDFEYVRYTSEYTVINAKINIIKYFKNALINNWAEEYILKKKTKELKKDREKFTKKPKSILLPIEKIDLELELLKNQKSMIVENMDLVDFGLKI